MSRGEDLIQAAVRAHESPSPRRSRSSRSAVTLTFTRPVMPVKRLDRAVVETQLMGGGEPTRRGDFKRHWCELKGDCSVRLSTLQPGSSITLPCLTRIWPMRRYFPDFEGFGAAAATGARSFPSTGNCWPIV